jgi:exonuclease III
MKIATWNVNSIRARQDRLLAWLILATEPLAKCRTVAEIDRAERKGEKPSDHAPVMVIIMERGADAQ